MTDYTSFRQRLDAVLRTRDVKQVQEFLMAEGQWHPGQPADAEFAMWMMIAGSATLREMHEQARQWLVGHGHEAEASMVLNRGQSKGQNRGQNQRQGKQQYKGQRREQPRGQVRGQGKGTQNGSYGNKRG